MHEHLSTRMISPSRRFFAGACRWFPLSAILTFSCVTFAATQISVIKEGGDVIEEGGTLYLRPTDQVTLNFANPDGLSAYQVVIDGKPYASGSLRERTEKEVFLYQSFSDLIPEGAGALVASFVVHAWDSQGGQTTREIPMNLTSTVVATQVRHLSSNGAALPPGEPLYLRKDAGEAAIGIAMSFSPSMINGYKIWLTSEDPEGPWLNLTDWTLLADKCKDVVEECAVSETWRIDPLSLPDGWYLLAVAAVGAEVTTMDMLPVAVGSDGDVVTTFTGASAYDTGALTATVAGGGAQCKFVPGATATESADNKGLPFRMARPMFPHGLLTFELNGCDVGSSVTIATTWPHLEDFRRYQQYGPTPASPQRDSWYTAENVRVYGNTVLFTVTDGGFGDDDMSANGVIRATGGASFGVMLEGDPIPSFGWPYP